MLKVARVGIHNYEEPCLSGERGSGTIFFCGCNLSCIFCQNYEISHGANKGIEISEDEFVSLCKYLEDIGAHNINLVTPSNYINSLIPAIKHAKEVVKLPFVWNSSGYETVANIQKLDGIIDIYLPDFKYSDDCLAWEYSHAKGYRDVAIKAISEMRKQCNVDVFDDMGVMQKGLIVRHLVLPNHIDNTIGVIKDIAAIDKSMYVSLMGQYFPTQNVLTHPKLNRRLTQDEYDIALDCFFDSGLTNGFSQDLDSAIEDYVPSFDLQELKVILDGIKRC